LKIGTIADLIAYRRRTETIVERSLTRTFTSIHGGDFALHIYVNKVAYAEHIALVKGDIGGTEPVLVRMHALNVLEDVLGDRSHSHGGELQASMRMIADAGRGVIVLLREAKAASLSEKLSSQGIEKKEEHTKATEAQNRGDPHEALRDYGIGAQILLDLGVREMILLSNSQRVIVGLDGYGLHIAEQRAIKG
jgi:3,4-dihydroxy 2-butanone 4-phosphate synthase/GTP cyclohydrolase II